MICGSVLHLHSVQPGDVPDHDRHARRILSTSFGSGSRLFCSNLTLTASSPEGPHGENGLQRVQGAVRRSERLEAELHDVRPGPQRDG